MRGTDRTVQYDLQGAFHMGSYCNVARNATPVENVENKWRRISSGSHHPLSPVDVSSVPHPGPVRVKGQLSIQNAISLYARIPKRHQSLFTKTYYCSFSPLSSSWACSTHQNNRRKTRQLPAPLIFGVTKIGACHGTSRARSLTSSSSLLAALNQDY
jgi:hypothetical protein